jgi:glycosyltransferase involved in cell wall biosynthesis
LKFNFVSLHTFEPWDWRNPDIQGIGGSETSHIEMAQRLQKRGHEVVSYAPIPFDEPQIHNGVLWKPVCKKVEQGKPSQWLIDWSEPCDVWVIYRAPELADCLPEGANAWLICQDVDYAKRVNGWTDERRGKFTRIVALCGAHKAYLEARYPKSKGRIVQSSNGIKRELIEKIAGGGWVRNPRRIMYASSPDRGMEYLLDVFPRAKEIVPDLELHIYYGFDNIHKIVTKCGPDHWISRNAERLKSMLNQPGVFDHGRMGQPDLIREWFKAGIWCHPSTFTETSCITSMDAQSCGAIPITTPIWAVAENVQHGVFIEGDVRSDLIRSRFAFQLQALARDAERQEAIRREMMPWARDHFTWERFVTQWDEWAREDVQSGSGATYATSQVEMPATYEAVPA